MRRTLTALVVAVLVVLGLAPTASANRTTLVLDEVVPPTGVTFIPACNPATTPGCNPRGPGSVLISRGDLLQAGAVVGTVDVVCLTTRFVAGDYYGLCGQQLVLPEGTVYALGEVNESAIERFEAQTIPVVGGTGAYAGQRGKLTILQTVFPDEFRLTVTLR